MNQSVSDEKAYLWLLLTRTVGINNRNMKLGNLIKLMDQYRGEKIQPCRGFQCEVTERSKWLELLPVKGSLEGHGRSNRTWLGHCSAPRYRWLEFATLSIMETRIVVVH